MTCSSCDIQGHNKRGCKIVRSENHGPSTTSDLATTTTEQATTPMHNRGVGVYIYPNGHQRIAIVSEYSFIMF